MERLLKWDTGCEKLAGEKNGGSGAKEEEEPWHKWVETVS